MQVAIDISGQFAQMTGIQYSVDSLLNALFALDLHHNISVFAPQLGAQNGFDAFSDIGLFQWRNQPHASIDFAGNDFAIKDLPVFKKSRLHRKFANVVDGRLLNPYKQMTKQQRIQSAVSKYDVMHVLDCPGIACFEYPVKHTVVTIYDVTPITLPQMHKPGAVDVWKPYFEFAKNRAARIIGISDHSKPDVIEHLGVPADRIDVTPLAARVSTERITDMQVIDDVHERLGLQNTPFVLYAGTLEPRKNLMRLINAFGVAVAEGRLPDHKLVLAGGNWNRHDLELRLHAYEIGIGDRVVTTGYVSNTDMNALMSSCEAFAYVSEYEGFGMPPLEAMVCGAPVVASNTTSLPEVIGDAGIQVDPLDVDAIAAGLHSLLTDTEENQRRRGLSLARAKLFSWERTARLTVQSYEAAVA